VFDWSWAATVELGRQRKESKCNVLLTRIVNRIIMFISVSNQYEE
jgi:hypothetical protein